MDIFLLDRKLFGDTGLSDLVYMYKYHKKYQDVVNCKC